MKEIASYVIDSLKKHSKGEDKHVYFSKPYLSVPFDKSHFHELKEKSDVPLAFIDGGNAELLQSSQFSLQLLRVYGSSYLQKKKFNSKIAQFYAFIHTKKSDGRLFYCVKFFGCKLLREDDFCMDFPENESKEMSVATIGQLIRRCAELSFAQEYLLSLKEKGILILDGSLQCADLIEKKYLEPLISKARADGVVLGAISKTTGLVTDCGNSVQSALSAFSVHGTWQYHPVATIEDELYPAELSFVRLHEKSKYIFKFEVLKSQKQSIKEAAEHLCSISSDSVFLGYPYGLIDADMHARISKIEKQQLALQVRVLMGKDWELLENSLNSANAHEILDKVNYG